MTEKPRLWVLNGPNLGRLGQREPAIYGRLDYAALKSACESHAAELGWQAEVRQSDRLSDLVDWLEQAARDAVPVVLNPAAFTHYSAELQAACAKHSAPLIEVHISNPHAREKFRHHSVISPVADGTIAGLGVDSYLLAITAIAHRLRNA